MSNTIDLRAVDNGRRDAMPAVASSGLKVAVVIPCHNEEAAIGKVVRDFRAALPEAVVYVYDNRSSDATADEARLAGAIVRSEWLPGKGNVVRRMFADVEADVYVLVDGDDTYDAGAAPRMVHTLLSGELDMVTASRSRSNEAAYRTGHRFGNTVLSRMVSTIFGHRFDDMLSGYRALSRRFVKSFPALAPGFEIETELTVHALELRMPTAEIVTEYRERAEGTSSKLNTIADGWRIFRKILVLVKEERPFRFFGLIALALAGSSIGLALPLFYEYLQSGLVPRLPTALLSTALMLLAFIGFACGLILETVTRGRQEMKRMHYLSIPVTRAVPGARSSGETEPPGGGSARHAHSE